MHINRLHVSVVVIINTVIMPAVSLEHGATHTAIVTHGPCNNFII